MNQKCFSLLSIVLAVCAFQCAKKNNPVAPVPTGNPVAMTKSQVATFFGVADTALLQGKLVYVIDRGTAATDLTYFVDFASLTDTLRPQQLCATSDIHAPLISPSGTHVAFWTGTEAAGGTMYAAPLAANATPVSLGAGYEPHWWVNPADLALNVVYCTVLGSSLVWNITAGTNDPIGNPGATLRQKVDPTALTIIDAPVQLLANSMNGGLSKSGRYLATAYTSTGIYDLSTSQWFQVSSGQACNGSISPSSVLTEESKMMYLTLGGIIGGTTNYLIHEAIVIDDIAADMEAQTVDLIAVAEGNVIEWQKPEWSTNAKYATALGKSNGIWDVYLINLTTHATAKIVSNVSSGGSFAGYPHLWVPGTY